MLEDEVIKQRKRAALAGQRAAMGLAIERNKNAAPKQLLLDELREFQGARSDDLMQGLGMIDRAHAGDAAI